ncbi:MAG: GCN5-related N-acetyltransferase [Halothiobacillaceae bacterium]|nr:MAG: GCN5-related N-acetyltransferase [Halothiobacillaceae bacterium]
MHKDYHNRGIGSALLRDALLRALQAATIAGVAALLVHALSEPAKRFYLSHGFVESPANPMTLCVMLATIK